MRLERLMWDETVRLFENMPYDFGKNTDHKVGIRGCSEQQFILSARKTCCIGYVAA
jgi:hypothetical protein